MTIEFSKLKTKDEEDVLINDAASDLFEEADS
jgi:hypothetical protein